MKYKVDLHTHSLASYDGGIKAAGYRKIFEKNILDFAAITDHNDIGFAVEMRQELGDRIIIGEEVMTSDGEIIGLFLEKAVPKHMTALETVKLIKKQNGLVYIPHPFERQRKGMDLKSLTEIVEFTDIIEVFNGRARFRGMSAEAQKFARDNKIANAAGSDAHCMMGIGTSYSIISHKSSVSRLKDDLAGGNLETKYAPLASYLCPFINKIKGKVRKYVK